MASLQNAKIFLRHYCGKLMGYPNVVAVSLGRKETGGNIRKKGWVLRIHVSAKTPLRSRYSVPRTLPAPPGRKHLGRIETDVIQTGATELHAGLQSGTDLRIGERGTLGCILVKEDGRRFALTAGHVLSGSLVVDPTRNGSLEFGTLPDAEVPGVGVIGIPFRCSRKNPFVDLGLVLLLQSVEVHAKQLVKGVRDVGVPSERLRQGERITVVRRHGKFRTTFHEGADRDGCVSFEYPAPDGVGRIKVIFQGIVFYPRLGADDELAGGDSGSAVLDGDGNLVGIHIGASLGTPSGGDSMLLGYAIPTAEIRKWAPDMQLLSESGPTSL